MPLPEVWETFPVVTPLDRLESTVPSAFTWAYALTPLPALGAVSALLA
jgi:hypothetical protein